MPVSGAVDAIKINSLAPFNYQKLKVDTRKIKLTEAKQNYPPGRLKASAKRKKNLKSI
ncbi:MAG: hypothetical protein ACR5K4_01050 [Sodalis sp. (in: enterobacteria)]